VLFKLAVLAALRFRASADTAAFGLAYTFD
jgi:hypothetical protein